MRKMSKSPKNRIIRIGAYFLFILGIIISIALLGLAVGLFMILPESSLQKRVIVSGLLIFFGIATFLISLSVFETMIEIADITTKDNLLDDRNDKKE